MGSSRFRYHGNSGKKRGADPSPERIKEGCLEEEALAQGVRGVF